MKRLLLSAIILFVCQLSSFAESSKDIRDLRQIVKSEKNQAKIDAQNSLCYALIQNDELNEAKELIREIKSEAQNLTYQKGLSNAFDNEGWIYMARYDYVNAMESFLSAADIRTGLGDEALIATSKNNIGHVYLLKGEYNSAIDYLNQAINIREKRGNIGESAETHKLFGDAYLKKKLFGKAKNHYKRAMDLRTKMEDFEGAAEIASFLGEIVTNLGDHEGALVYYNMSLNLNSTLENLPNIARDYTNIAAIYQAQEAYDEALESHNIALNIRKDLDEKIGLAETYKNMAVLYAEQKKKTNAIKFLDKSANILSDISEDPGVYRIYRVIAQTFGKLGEHKKAYQYHTAYTTTKDDFISEEKDKAIAVMTTRFNSETEAKEQANRIAKLESEQSSANKIRLFLLALVGMMGMLAMSLYSNNRRKKKDNELLTVKNKEIERQSTEIDNKNDELEDKNIKLDVLNGKLVDEMAERESIEKSSFERDSFLATMSHEMRTPMNAIVGYTHLLLDEEPKDNQIEHLRNLQFSANNLTVFINDILDFSKIEAGKLTLQNRKFSTHSIFDEIHQRFQRPIEDKNLKFNYFYDDRIPEHLLGDPARLNQILNNLVATSLQHTDKGSINMDVYLDEFNTKEAILKINIKDTSNGLDPELVKKMFQKFNSETKDVFEGYERSGIALSMAKRLTELQNGKIEVDNNIGKGTTFTILLPFKCVEVKKETVANVTPTTFDNTPVVATETTSNTANNEFEGVRVLIVEDNKINQLVVAKMLKRMGMIIGTANNGQEALDHMHKSDFDLVLMDIQMPIMDGYKATSEIRNMQDVKKSNIPIIALTASAFLSETEKANLFGMNDHVGKPFGPDDLMDKISLCLANVKAHSPSNTTKS